MSESTKPTADDVTQAVVHEATLGFDYCLEKIAHCLDQLSDEQVWWRPHKSMNSIGNILLHLCGNVRQWIVAGVGGADDVRERPSEFSESGPIPKSMLLGQLEQVVGEAKDALRAASSEGMLAPRRVQGYDVNGWGAVFDSIPHFRGHTQEIICMTRMQLGDDYKFHWQPQTPEEGA